VQNFLGVRYLHLHLSFITAVLLDGFIRFEVFNLFFHLDGLAHKQIRDLRDEVLLTVVLIVL
jgi:hypothetical protein